MRRVGRPAAAAPISRRAGIEPFVHCGAQPARSNVSIYSRENPSPRYRELVRQYQLMHQQGDVHSGMPAEHTFAGRSVLSHAKIIKSLCEHFQAATLLDYGAGKGDAYRAPCVSIRAEARQCTLDELWGIQSLTCYDPGYPPFAMLPRDRFDAVICIDVLEHCPAEDMSWILDELFGLAGKFVYASVACFAAHKRLTNGENAHCTVRPVPWWRERLAETASRHPEPHYYFLLTHAVGGPETQLYRSTIVSGKHSQIKVEQSPVTRPPGEVAAAGGTARHV